MNINLYTLDTLSPSEIAQLCKRSEMDISELQKQVQPIIQNVRDNGDLALIEYNKKFDKATMTVDQLKVTEAIPSRIPEGVQHHEITIEVQQPQEIIFKIIGERLFVVLLGNNTGDFIFSRIRICLIEYRIYFLLF